ncbi:hypothetical protein [Bacillus sp. JJ1764]|uniref:hypothetical protein n=1 Tax=Bacillus sp. JJ1764 TaxID=3122964 RepID=UPI002FFF1922
MILTGTGNLVLIGVLLAIAIFQFIFLGRQEGLLATDFSVPFLFRAPRGLIGDRLLGPFPYSGRQGGLLATVFSRLFPSFPFSGAKGAYSPCPFPAIPLIDGRL